MIPGIVAGTAFGTTQVVEGDADPLWKYVQVLLFGDGVDGDNVAAQEYSMRKTPLTINGSPELDTSVDVEGTPSIQINAKGDQIRYPNDPQVRLWHNAPDFCFEIYGALTGANDNWFLNQRRNSGGFTWILDQNRMAFNFWRGTRGRQVFSFNYPSPLTLGQVYHFCVLRVGQTFYAFLDGVLVDSVLYTNTSLTYSSSDLYIGNGDTNSSRYFKGNFNWCRLTFGHSRYDETGFTPPETPMLQGFPGSRQAALDPDFSNVQLLLSFDGVNGATSAVDESDNLRVVSFVGDAALSDAKSKFGATSLFLDGSGDRVSIDHSTDISADGDGSTAADDFTVEGWFNPASMTTARTLFAKADNSLRDDFLVNIEDDGQVRWRLYEAGSEIADLRGFDTEAYISVDTWNHIACTRQGRMLYLFVNGYMVASSFQIDAPTVNTSPFDIGFDDGGSIANFHGYVSEFRFVKGQAVYTQPFLPPTAPHARTSATPEAAPNPAFANVSLLLGFEGTDGDTTTTDEADGRTVTFVGGAEIDDAQAKFGSTSLLLPGTNDYLSVPHSSDLSIASNSKFTVEAWVRPTAACLAKSIAVIVNKRKPNDDGDEFWLYVADGDLKFTVWSTSGSVQAAGIPLTADTWHHVAGMRDGSNLYLFLDGALVGNAVTNTPESNTAPVLIGRDGFSTGREWDGHIDEVRITRDAFYPLIGFIPPASAFPRS